MAILNRFSAIVLYCDPAPAFASRCKISGDFRPAILGSIRDSVPLRFNLSAYVGCDASQHDLDLHLESSPITA